MQCEYSVAGRAGSTIAEVNAGKTFHHNQQDEGGGAGDAGAAAVFCVDQRLCCVAHLCLCSIDQLFEILLRESNSSRNEVVLLVCQHF